MCYLLAVTFFWILWTTKSGITEKKNSFSLENPSRHTFTDRGLTGEYSSTHWSHYAHEEDCNGHESCHLVLAQGGQGQQSCRQVEDQGRNSCPQENSIPHLWTDTNHIHMLSPCPSYKLITLKVHIKYTSWIFVIWGLSAAFVSLTHCTKNTTALLLRNVNLFHWPFKHGYKTSLSQWINEGVMN